MNDHLIMTSEIYIPQGSGYLPRYVFVPQPFHPTKRKLTVYPFRFHSSYILWIVRGCEHHDIHVHN